VGGDGRKGAGKRDGVEGRQKVKRKNGRYMSRKTDKGKPTVSSGLRRTNKHEKNVFHGGVEPDPLFSRLTVWSGWTGCCTKTAFHGNYRHAFSLPLTFEHISRIVLARAESGAARCRCLQSQNSPSTSEGFALLIGLYFDSVARNVSCM